MHDDSRPWDLEVLLESIARFVRDRLVPNEAVLADTDAVPADIVADMKALGLFGLSIPEQYGGLGLTTEEEIRVALVL
ncbi:MAG: acyl-CoA dehydrogenase family protein, partial [Gammaproteobacteria bacterium]|nr:acyl-CoA dehydrogenase family protein [Gammaproteobacteria bacterium]